jgi:hypothetical protein
MHHSFYFTTLFHRSCIRHRPTTTFVLASAINQRPLFPLVAGNLSLPIILFVRRPKTHQPMPDHLIVG